MIPGKSSVLTLLFGIVFLSPMTVSAQAPRATDPNGNLWVSQWGDHRFHERWSIHTEAHWRRADLGMNWQQLLVRPAINFHLNDQVMFKGYSYYFNYR